ncbi:MAG TPA: hypothetical protein VHX44_09505, partial [Planctomycetota bacterium]|nr:hypothetical protein [Planctomycetota bacterium]
LCSLPMTICWSVLRFITFETPMCFMVVQGVMLSLGALIGLLLRSPSARVFGCTFTNEPDSERIAPEPCERPQEYR